MPHMRYEWCEVCSWSEVIFSKERLFSLSLFQYMLLENYIKLSRTFLFYRYIPKDYDHMYFSNRKSNTWMKNFQRFSLYCPLTVMHKNVEEIIIYYQQKMTVNCLFSGFLLAWISAVSASSHNLPRKTSKSNKQLISSSEVNSRKLETKSKTIIYCSDLSGRHFFVCQLKIALFFLHELIKQRSSDVTGRHYRLNDSDVSLVEFATRGDGWNSF